MVKKYVAAITSLNGDKIGTHPTGEATFTVDDETLMVEITMDHTSPNTQHWMHFHGFPDGKDAQPATIAQDTNGDGYVDLPETRMLTVISIIKRKCHWQKSATNSKKSLMTMIPTWKSGLSIFMASRNQWNYQIRFKAQLASMTNTRRYRLRWEK